LQRVGEAFSPFHPIQVRDFFAGRVEQIGRIEQALRAGGQHVILYGDRGVGKTSLSNIVPFLTRKRCFTHRCSSDDGYERIFGHFLKDLGHTSAVTGKSTGYESKKY